MAEEIVADTDNAERIDVCYFSWRGATKKVAEQIARSLEDYQVQVIEIKPLRHHPYITWLILSFIPGFGVKSTFNEPESDVVFLCLPKWTFNCPPVTYFLKKVNLAGKTVFLAITYGGFDEKRYAASLKKRIRRMGARAGDVILVKRRHLEENPEKVMEEVSNWAVRCIRQLWG